MKTNLSFGKLAVAVIAVSALANVAARFLPASMIAFRTSEAAIVDFDSIGIFRANFSVRKSRSYGDLAAFGNRRSERQYRVESLTTDECGNRNDPGILRSGGPVDAILLGSSFTNGSGLSDWETLASQYGAATELKVYNAAKTYDMNAVYSFDTLLSFAQALHLKPGGEVIFEHNSRYSDGIGGLGPDDGKVLPIAELCRKRNFHTDFIWYLHNREGLSPLSILSQQALRYFEDDRILPNSSRDQAVVDRLQNGKDMLFLPLEIRDAIAFRDEKPVLGMFRELEARLSKYGYHLRVLLMPSKYDVYEPLILKNPSAPSRSPEYFDRLERGLHEAGIPVINLGPVFRKSAREQLASDQTIYWTDDTHWNSLGVRTAVQEMVRQWKK